jgi:hypothetical protein
MSRRRDVICSFCGEPWSKYDANHQPGCNSQNRFPLHAPNVRELEVVPSSADLLYRPANTAPRLAARFAALGGRRR